TVTVENAGNLAETVVLQVADLPPGWRATLSESRVPLSVGGAERVRLSVERPGVAPATGVSDAAPALVLLAHHEEAAGGADVLRVPLTIERHELSLGAARRTPLLAIRAGDDVRVDVPVSNAGDGPARDLVVGLFVDGVLADAVVLPEVGAGATVPVSLGWVAARGARAGVVVVDPFAKVVEADETDNAVAVDLGVDAGGLGEVTGLTAIPGPGLLFLSLAVAAACIMCRRRTQK
ncbi:MAG: CARDB domain-containing protein, partial [Methanobacteriota archaeon]